MDYLKSGGQTEDENLKRFISLGSAMTNAEFLVCNDSGYALLTADQRLGGKVVAIPQEITQEVLTGSGLYQGRSSLGGRLHLQTVRGRRPRSGRRPDHRHGAGG